MKQLEIVHLRSSREPVEGLADLLSESIRPGVEAGQVVTLYRQHGLNTDLAVHIRSSPSSQRRRSNFALQLAAALRIYGLVEHTVWEEVE